MKYTLNSLELDINVISQVDIDMHQTNKQVIGFLSFHERRVRQN